MIVCQIVLRSHCLQVYNLSARHHCWVYSTTTHGTTYIALHSTTHNTTYIALHTIPKTLLHAIIHTLLHTVLHMVLTHNTTYFYKITILTTAVGDFEIFPNIWTKTTKVFSISFNIAGPLVVTQVANFYGSIGGKTFCKVSTLSVAVATHY